MLVGSEVRREYGSSFPFRSQLQTRVVRSNVEKQCIALINHSCSRDYTQVGSG